MVAARLLLTGLLLLILAASAWAQAPRVTNAPLAGADVFHGEPVPDTTDWRSYFPLEIGNAWQYRVTTPEGGVGHYGYDIVGDTLLEGESYFMLRTCYNREPILCTDQEEERRYRFIRYSPGEAMVLEYCEIKGRHA